MSELILFKITENKTEIEVKLQKDTVWLNRHQIALLFERDIKTIGKHINNIFDEKELVKKEVVANFATTTKHGALSGKTQTKDVEYYNLDVIISVGYRVKSQRGVIFRQWATQRLKDYLVKGFSINLKLLEENKTKFLQTLEDLKLLSNNNQSIETKDILSLIQSFSNKYNRISI